MTWDCQRTSGASAEGFSDIWGLESSGGFFTHMSGIWPGVTQRLDSAGTVVGDFWPWLLHVGEETHGTVWENIPEAVSKEWVSPMTRTTKAARDCWPNLKVMRQHLHCTQLTEPAQAHPDWREEEQTALLDGRVAKHVSEKYSVGETFGGHLQEIEYAKFTLGPQEFKSHSLQNTVTLFWDSRSLILFWFSSQAQGPDSCHLNQETCR